MTDSLTPRMFIIVSSDERQRISTASLQRGQRGRQEAEDRVGARRDRDGDREHVVDEQRGARDHAQLLPEELGRDDVAAAARGELLDDAAVPVADDEDGQRRREREEDGEPGVLAELAERLVRTVRARREPVGAEPDPGEERDERELVERVRILDVLRRAEEEAA